MKRQQPEAALQRSCVTWFRKQYPKLLLIAIPNGGKRSKIEAAIMQGLGVTAGVPDLVLLKRTDSWGALFIEMKADKGKLTDKQRLMHDDLLRAGYAVTTCRSLNDFMENIKYYLSN
jgi:hypothetical protein